MKQPPLPAEIRELKNPDELQMIRDIANDVWPKTFRDILSPEQIVYMMKMMYSPEVMQKEMESGYRFAVLFINTRPAGYISWSAYPPAEGTAKLHKVYLLENFQHFGYGRMMLEYVAGRCREAGFTRLRLNVNKFNKNAISAYLRAGYQNIQSVKNDIGNGFFMDDFVMERPL